MKSYLSAIGTANPRYKIAQSAILDFMANALSMDEKERRRLQILYRASGIKYRYSVLEDYALPEDEFQFFPPRKDLEPFPTISPRMGVYQQEASQLAMKAVQNCLQQQQNVSPSEITHLITISCTGMYAPGLDIELIEQLGMPNHVQRTAINFMGCYGAFNGLKVADAICKANPDAKVMVVSVELCTLHFQKSKEEDHLLSGAIFSDGAAAVLMEGKPSNQGIQLVFEDFYCDLFTEGKKDMAWKIADHGFEMVLSSYIPTLIGKGIETLIERLLSGHQLSAEEVDFFAIHPGGKKIIEVIEHQLAIERRKSQYAYDVLRNYGNMSSATILFVLKELMEDLTTEDIGKSVLGLAFGPGLTMESMLLRVNGSKG